MTAVVLTDPTPLEDAIVHSKKLRPRTKELYLQHVRAFLTFVGAAWSADHTLEWRTERVVKWCADMRKRKIRPQSINVALNALRFAARRAGETFVDSIQTLPVRAAKARTKTDRPLTLAEGRKLIVECTRSHHLGNRARGLRDNAIILLGLRTGMLRFSMCQLQLTDLQLRVGKPKLTFEKKGGERHTILVDEITATALTEWVTWLRLNDVDTGHVFRSLGRSRVLNDTPVSIGKHLTPDGLYRALQQRAKQAKLHDLSSHVFRRTFVEWAKAAGAQPSQIALVTGHKSEGDDDDNSTATIPANFLIPDITK